MGGRVLCARIILTAAGGLQNNLRCSRLRSLRSLMRLLSCFDEPTVLILQQTKTKRTHPYGRVLPVLAGVAGFEPTNAAVKVLCLTA